MVDFIPWGKEKKFIDINLAERKKKRWFKISFKEKISTKTIIISSFSFISFISIFIVYFYFKNRIAETQIEISKLNRKIHKAHTYTLYLKKIYKNADKKFQKFYISGLKEKLFYIFFSKKFHSNLWYAVETYKNFLGDLPPFIGFVEYPNPYKKLEYEKIQPLEKHLFFYKKLSKNFFLDPEFVKNTLQVYLTLKPIDKRFQKYLSSIKDEEIKANLLLEYQLLVYGINALSAKVPVYVIIPVNLAFADTQLYKNTFQFLKQYCNVLIVDKQYTYKVFFKKPHLRTVLDGICIKQTF